MGFPVQSCVNERKQGSASQGFHCGVVDCSTFKGLIEGNLQELGPYCYLHTSVGNPLPGKQQPSSIRLQSAICYMLLSDNIVRYTYDSEATPPNLTFGSMPTSLDVLPVLYYGFAELIKLKSSSWCNPRSKTCGIYCWRLVNRLKKHLRMFDGHLKIYCMTPVHILFSC